MSSTITTPSDPILLGRLADPHVHYARLQREAPIYRIDATPQNSLISMGSIWVVTRYDDAITILRDPERFRQSPFSTMPPELLAAMPPMPVFMQTVTQSMLLRDPPDHTRLRGLTNHAFTPRAIKRLEGQTQVIADRLIDALPERGETDLALNYSWRLPLAVICDMMGIPEEDRPQFHDWVLNLNLMPTSPEEVERSNVAVLQFLGYAERLVEARRKSPRDDVTTALVQAEQTGDQLSMDELKTTLVQLLFAGHETSARLISNGVLTLLKDRSRWDLLVAEPARIDAVVEEILRFESSSHHLDRWATEDFEMHGETIRRGDRVLVLLPAVNRDPSRFERPDEVDFNRTDKGHLAFGHGIHFCLGAQLARMETRIGIGTLARRLPALRLKAPGDDVPWDLNGPIRGVRELPVITG